MDRFSIIKEAKQLKSKGENFNIIQFILILIQVSPKGISGNNF